MLVDELVKRKVFLEKIVSATNKNLMNRKGGSIRAAKRGESVRYYYKDTPGLANGVYLPVGKIDIAKEIVQQEYDEKIAALAENELKLINKLLKLEKPDAFVREYEKLGEYRKPLVSPYKISDEEYAAKWQEEKYQGRQTKPGETIHYSIKNEIMHSKAEANIADTCTSLGIPYKYEYPHKILVPDDIVMPYQSSEGQYQMSRRGAKHVTCQTWYPDFTALNKRTREEYIVEYFGLMGNDDYRKNALQKIEIYRTNGIYIGKNFIAFFEGGDYIIDEKVVRETLEMFLT